MHWRDIDDDTWEGLTVTLTRDELPAHPRWNTDVVRPGRVRITAGDVARWWGRQARDLACVSLLRGAPMTHDAAVVRPITRDDLSAVTAPPGTIAWWRSWSLWFLDAMVASGRSPLRPGLWGIAPVDCRDLARQPVVDRVVRRATLPPCWDAARTRITHAHGPAWTEDLWDEDWYVNGSGGLLPLRRPSPPDSGRVKSWRKRAREGTLRVQFDLRGAQRERREAHPTAIGPRDPLENSGVRRPVGARDPRLTPGNRRRSPGRAGLLDAVDAQTHCAHRSLCRRELPPSVHCGALLDSCNPALPGDRLPLPGVSRGSRAPTGRRTPEFSRGSRGPMAIQGVNLPLKSNCTRTLPPLLVYAVSALDMFVLLDGHDRYAAAVAEGVPVPGLHVTGLTFTPVNLDLRQQAVVVREVERLLTLVPAVPTASIKALVAGAFDDRPWPSHVCFGRPLAGGARQWDLEVTRRLAALGLSERGAVLLA